MSHLASNSEAIFEALADGHKLDSAALHEHVKMFRGQKYPKRRTDDTLYQLCRAGDLFKSKNPMTDANAGSQSKFLYYTHHAAEN